MGGAIAELRHGGPADTYVMQEHVGCAKLVIERPQPSSRGTTPLPGRQVSDVDTSQKNHTMPFITTKDGTEIFYKDWGSGQPVVFSHGWPLTADAWDPQAKLVVDNGFRAIAHDRRGGGRSGQPWDGNDLDTYAEDLASLIETLDLRDVILVGHS